jgi:hypothetical protein
MIHHREIDVNPILTLAQVEQGKDGALLVLFGG